MIARAAILGAVGSVLVVSLVAAARRAGALDRARGLRARAARHLPGGVRGTLARALTDAGVGSEPEQAVRLWLGGTGVAGLCGLAMGSVPATLGVLGGLVAGPAGLALARSRARLRAASAVPAGLERVAAELRGGGTVETGVAVLAGRDGPLGPGMGRVRARLELGATLPDALDAWSRELGTPQARAAGGAMAVVATVGGSAADALDGLAASLRDRLAAQAEARALSAQARLSTLVVAVAPLGYLLFSSLVDRGATSVLLGSGVGRLCLGGGLALEAVAGLWMRRLLRVEP